MAGLVDSNPWLLSSGLHLALVAFALLLIIGMPTPKKSNVDIEILEAPKLASQPIQITKPTLSPAKPKAREVFGLSRKSLTSDQGEEGKAGNTVAKTPDNLKLKPEDQESLPIPTDEYLVTRMPELKAEVRIPYPMAAKKKGIEGAVIMDLLIDTAGKVREVSLVEGPSDDLNASAMAAVRGFEFKPALVQEKPVAVRIRYAYRFVLER